MPKRPERNFFEQLRRNVPRSGLRHDLQRIENTTCNGVPDVSYLIDGAEGWAELKAWDRVRLSGRFTIPGLREEQAAWLFKRASLGGRAYLLMRVNKDVVLIDGRYAPALFNRGLQLDWNDASSIATLWLKPPIDWDRLARALAAPPVDDTVTRFGLARFRARPITRKVSDL